jgi:hypothetical protein
MQVMQETRVETSLQKHGSVALGLITHCLTITPWEELHLMFVVPHSVPPGEVPLS